MAATFCLRGVMSRPMLSLRGPPSLPLLAMTSRLQSTKVVDGKSQWVGLINDQDFFDKNKKMQRPMSPHLTIYRFPLPAILSIAHRGTGIALTGVISAAAIGLMVHPLAFYVDAVKALEMAPVLLTATKFTLAFPFTYHTFNGIRHLVWDTARSLGISDIYTSGYATVGLALAASTALALL